MKLLPTTCLLLALTAGLAGQTPLQVDVLRARAEKGDLPALLQVAYWHATGKVLERDLVEAARLYRKAADKGHSISQYILGGMYKYGVGVKQDQTECYRWFRKSAEGGYCEAQFVIGIAYGTGTEGLPRDEAESLHWLRRAGDQGHAEAQQALGLLYAQGMAELRRDPKLACDWMRKAAERGKPVAQMNLAMYLSLGYGTEKDEVEAHAWYNLAGANGVSAAKEKMAELEKVMSKEQVREATNLARKKFGKMLPDMPPPPPLP